MKPLLVVDGYNVIGAWQEAAREAWTMDESRDRLLHRLQDYAGYSGDEIVLVFDGYRSDRRTAAIEERAGVTLVFTPHAETADSYIERLVAQTPRYRQVRVATSDGLEQSQVQSTGASRMSARELLRELHRTSREAARASSASPVSRSPLGARLPASVRDKLESIRRSGKT